MADAEIRAVITAKDQATSVLQGFSNTVGGVNVASIAAVAGVGALTAAAVASVSAFQDSQNIASQLNNVLASTGGVAGVTSDEAIKLSKSLEHLTGISDETALNAENILLTFTNIKKDAFPGATQAAVDMATALNHGMVPSMEDVQAKAMLIGKALQDPDAGLGALHRVGVNVDELKKKFTDSMSIEEKQKLILQELGTEFGGAGKAAGDTFAGSIHKAQENMNDLMEAIGGLIAKAIQPVVNWFNRLFERLGGIDGITKSLSEAWREISRVLNEVLGPPLRALWNQIQTQLLPALIEFWDKNKNWLIPALKDAAVVIGGALLGACLLIIATLYIVVTAVTAVVNAINWFGDQVRRVVAVNTQGWNQIMGVVHAVTGAFVGAWGWAIGTVSSFFNNLVNGIRNGLSSISHALSSVTGGALHIPGFATGVTNFSGGLALVGEQGPELVSLPRGSNVIPNTQINKVGGGASTININVNAGAFVGTQQDARKYAMLIGDALKDVANAKNTTVMGLLQ